MKKKKKLGTALVSSILSSSGVCAHQTMSFGSITIFFVQGSNLSTTAPQNHETQIEALAFAQHVVYY